MHFRIPRAPFFSRAAELVGSTATLFALAWLIGLASCIG